MPVETTKVGPANHHGLFHVLIKENEDPSELIAELALNFLIVLRAIIIVHVIFASFADEGVKRVAVRALGCVEKLSPVAFDMNGPQAEFTLDYFIIRIRNS
jgi:hypothetical protein